MSFNCFSLSFQDHNACSQNTEGVIYCNFICIFAQDWDRQNPTQIVTEMCGFVTILSGTFLLHKTKDMADGGTNFLLYRHLHLPLWIGML
jgi:hypothetical protein